MLIFGLFLIQLVAVLSAYFLIKRGIRLIYPWFLMTFIGFVVWLVILLISPAVIQPFHIQNWFRNDFSPIHLHFSITDLNWGLILAFLSTQIAFLLTTVADQNFKSNSMYWIIFSLAMTILYAILTAYDLFSLILLWTVWDVFEMGYWIFFHRKFSETTNLLPFFFKLSGSLVLITSAALLMSRGQSVRFNEIPESMGLLLLIASILHSGIILQPEFKKSSRNIDDAVASFVFLFTFFSSISLIMHLPFQSLPLTINLVLQLFILGIITKLGIQWLRDPSSLANLQILLAFFTSFYILQYLANSSLQSTQNWLTAMFMIISFSILYRYRNKATRLFPTLVLLIVSGIPFSLLSYKSSSILFDNPLLLMAFLIFHVIILVGFARRFYFESESFDDIDSLPQFVYLAGLLVPILTMFGITFHTMGSIYNETASWWIGPIILLSALGLSLWMKKKSLWDFNSETETSDQEKRKKKFFSSYRVFNTLEKVFNQVRPMIVGFSQLVEGEGGVLWSIVFLALLLTLIRVR